MAGDLGPTSWTLDGDDSGADVNLDTLWNDQLLGREDVLHLEQWLRRGLVGERFKSSFAGSGRK